MPATTKTQLKEPEVVASFLIAKEKGPGTVTKEFHRTMEGIRLEIIISVYTEIVGQVARQSRNVEQLAPELAKKAIQCADELIKALTVPPA